jgi:seryl-tRNA synthetase
MRAIKERELENQYRAQNVETEKEVGEIKKKAMDQVIAKRNKLKEKIAEMRKKARRSENKMKQQLMNVRLKIAKEIKNMHREGDQNKCKTAMKSEDERLKYCQINFDDIAKFSTCKEDDDFCTICCENEFGEMHIDKRNMCIKELCENKPVNTATAEGRWIWTKDFDSVKT